MSALKDHRATPSATLLSRLDLVFRRTWDLGLTSFGGPPVHFTIFHRRFVERYGWIDEQTYQELFAVCQALPGPASTKLGYCICLTYAGFLPALLEFVLWCLPGFVGMYALAIGISRVPETLPTLVYSLLSGMNSATVGLITVSGVTLSEKAITDRLTRVIVITAACAGLLYSALWYFPVLMVIGGTSTLLWDKYCGVKQDLPVNAASGELLPDGPNPPSFDADEETPLLVDTAGRPSYDRKDLMRPQYGSFHLGMVLVVIFFVTFTSVLLVRALVKSPPVEYKLFSNLFLAGTILFGGGPVVVPLLHDYIVNEGWVSSRDFLIGLAVIQSFPGPNFNFAVFLSALAASSTSSPPIVTAFLGFVGIFSPGMVLATGMSALWQTLRGHRPVTSLLRGVNAAAVGLVWTAVYRLWETGYLKPGNITGTSLSTLPWWVVIAAVTFSGNRWFNVPPPVAVAFGGMLGLLSVWVV